MQKKTWIGAVVALVALASCGDTTLEQVLYGAGAGATTAGLLGGDTATGALLGAGVNVYCQTSSELC